MNGDKIRELKEIAARFLKFGQTTPTPPPPVAAKFEAFKLKGLDTTLEVDPELTVGSEVKQSSGTGSIPATDGKFQLENGMEFTVKDGKIESVQNDGKQPDPNADANKTVTEKMEAVLAEFATVKSELAAFKTENESLKLEVQGYKEHIAKLPTVEVIEQFNADVKLFGQAIIELSEIPVETEGTKRGEPEAITQKETNFEAVAANFMGEQE
jgi:hypothetical protein